VKDPRGRWSQVYTGRRFYPFDPRPEDIFIEDFAHALSLECRYNGHCRVHYSVAEHSVRVARWVEKWSGRNVQQHRQLILSALLHDASEAYLKDLPTMIKEHPEMEFYRKAEHRVMLAVWERFGLSDFIAEQGGKDPILVKKSDLVLLATECRDIMGGEQAGDWHLSEQPLDEVVVPWSNRKAEREFLKMLKAFT